MRLTIGSKYFPDSFFRISLKGLCVRDGKILLIREPDETSGNWELPGGGLDFGEDIKSGLQREIEEETGLKIIKISDKPVYVWSYKYEANSRNIGWYYSFVVAYRVEFENLNFKPTGECKEIGFFSKEDMGNIILNGQITKLPDFFDPNDFKEEFV